MLAVGCRTNKCRNGTAYVTITFDAAAAAADTLRFTFSVDGAPAKQKTITRAAGGAPTAIEVAFDAGYPAGSTLDLSVQALLGTMPIGAGQLHQTLAPNCSALALSIASAMADLSTKDASGVDAALTHDQAQAIDDLSGSVDAADRGDLGTQDLSTQDLSAPPSTDLTGLAAFAPSADTVLPSGVYFYSSITIPSGVTVTTNGVGSLELHSASTIVIGGAIDVSGGNGGHGIQSTKTGGGSGGTTGSPVPGGVGSSACPSGGGGGSGTVGFGDFHGVCNAAGGNRGGGAGGWGDTATKGPGGGGGGYAGGAGGDDGGDGGSVGGGIGGNNTSASAGVGGMPGSAGGAPYDGAPGGAGPSASCGTALGLGGGGGSIGVDAANDLPVAATLYSGSAGGGGGGASTSAMTTYGGGGGGGGGGGALKLVAATEIQIQPGSALLANGGAGGQGGNSGASGGGGSGGVIYLSAPTITAQAATISAIGGSANGASTCSSPGGAGGLGRIRFSVTTCTITSMTPNPPFDSAGCTPKAAAKGKTFVATYPN